MQKKILSVLLALAFAVPALAQTGRVSRIKRVLGRRSIERQYIVVLNPEAAASDFEAVSARRGRRSVSDMASEMSSRRGGNLLQTFQVLRGFAVQMDEAQAEALAADPSVAYVEQDSEIQAFVNQTPATWGLDRIDQRDLPLNNTYTYTPTGAGVKAYIIDTGIRDSHTQFGGRVLSGFTAINDGNNTNDCNGHGTHVAGTVGSATYGVAKQVTLVAVRVLDCNGSGSNSGVIAGVDYVTANHNPGEPAVANMSLGGGASTALDNAVANSIADGVVYAIAAGNSTADACTTSPARVPTALTVGSSAMNDARSSFSNFGTCLDLFAPGSSITSTWNTNDTATNTISGTSMATPHVAGVVALYLENNRNATPAAVATALKGNATPNKITDPRTGSPNLLLYSIFGATPPPPPPTDQPPVARFTFSCTALTCSFNGSTSTDDKPPISSYTWNFGDNTTGSGVTASHTYAAAGSFQATLTVRDTANQSNTSPAQTVTVTNPGGTPPPCTACDKFTGTLSGTGASNFQPNGTYYRSNTSGQHQGWLRGPTTTGTDFDLYLLKWTGFSWATVARAEGTTSTEQITYNGTSGYYMWQIRSFRGSGAYEFWLKKPQ